VAAPVLAAALVISLTGGVASGIGGPDDSEAGVEAAGAVPVPALAMVGVLNPVGLNNGFGLDPKTQRTVTWLALNSAGYTAPYIKVAPAGSDISQAAPSTAGCTVNALGSGLSSYTAYSCPVRGLTPGTTYQYKVGAQASAGTDESATFSFTTEASSESTFTFLDFADSQSSPAATYTTFWANTLNSAIAAHPEAKFLVQNGDIGNSSSDVADWTLSVGTSLSGLAFNPVLGNHDDGSSEALMWDGLFPRESLTARPTATVPWPLQYSYVYGNALFLHINTNMYTPSRLTRTSTWVRQAVAANGKNPDGSDRFIIVVQHKSPFGGRHSGDGAYPTGDYGNPDIVKELPKTFAEVGVDLVLAGHDHNLIRSLPIKWDSVTGKAVWDRSLAGLTTINSVTDGLVYYIPRNSGSKTYAVINEPTTQSRPWVAWRWSFSDYGNTQPANTVYSVVTVSRDSIQVKSYRTGNPTTPVDQFTVVQRQPANKYEWFSLTPDLEGNGRGDILAVDATTGALDMHTTTTSGTLSSKKVLASSGLGRHRVFGPGDWNGDKKADIITVDMTGTMWLRAGNGAGGLAAPVQCGRGWTNYRIVPAGDLNGDGANDMLAIDQDGLLWLYAGNGKGGFIQGRTEVGHGWAGFDLYAAGDLNNDKKADILSINSSGLLYAYFGRGNGTFQAPAQVGRGWSRFTLAAGADLNGDGKADIVGRSDSVGDVYYYQGNGNGTFQASKKIATGW
jgi:hypothetical protein